MYCHESMLLPYMYSRSFLGFMNTCTYNYMWTYTVWSININIKNYFFYIIAMEVYMLLWNLHLDHQSVTLWSHWGMKWMMEYLVHLLLTGNLMWIQVQVCPTPLCQIVAKAWISTDTAKLLIVFSNRTCQCQCYHLALLVQNILYACRSFRASLHAHVYLYICLDAKCLKTSWNFYM